MVNDTEDYWPYNTTRHKDIFIKWPGSNQNTPDFADTNSTAMLGYVSVFFSTSLLNHETLNFFYGKLAVINPKLYF